MAQSTTTQSGITLIVPGAYAEVQVIANQGNIAQAGVVTLIGEADQGPDFSKETNLNNNAFGPDEIQAVQQKYGSGRLVDAFRTLVAAANDPNIVGGVSLVKIVKTNPSVAALSALIRNGFGAYGILTARSEGFPGNLIRYQVQDAQAEQGPRLSNAAYMPHYLGAPVSFDLRANGGALHAVSNAATTAGPAFVSSLQSLTRGILATGGQDLDILNGLATSAISVATVAGSTTDLDLTIAGPVPAAITVGDTLVIPLTGDYGAATTSSVIGGSNANRGSYSILSIASGVSSSTLRIRRVNAPSGAPAVASASATVGAGEIDVIVYGKVSLRDVNGQDRQSTVGMTGTFTTTVTGSSVRIEAPSDLTAQPLVGDIVLVPSAFASVLAGFYEVTASASDELTMLRLSEGSAGSSGSANIITPITQGTQPFVVQKPEIDGLGKTLEVVGNVDAILKNASTLAPAGVSNQRLLSSAERRVSVTIARGTEVSDTFIFGGDILLEVGYQGSNADMVVSATGINFRISAATQFSAPFAQYKTLNDVVTLVNSQPGWRAKLGAARFGGIAPQLLDDGTYACSSSLAGSYTARLKYDAHLFSTQASQGGLAVAAATATAGLPQAMPAEVFLAGGQKAGTTSAQMVAAIDACEGITTNFMVPCISKDASADILDGETEPTSTYVVDAVNAYLRSHCIRMSQVKSRANRLAIVSKSGTYDEQKTAAQQLASFRVALCFQDVRLVASDGTIKQYQPWMAAIVAAGMQAAAGYKGIVHKFAAITGIVKPEGDFNASRYSNLEDALQAGLLILQPVPTGGFWWVSDQMTYSIDNNFVYNSLQAVYIADLVALTMIQNFERAFVGRSVAEVSAAAALSFLDAQMSDFLRLRFTAPSQGADGRVFPKGYRNASARITGGVLTISVEIFLAGLLYFVPISIAISQVQQEASA